MDHLRHYRRETRSLETAARSAATADEAALVPSCPGWSVSDLVLHLGAVHRRVAFVIRERRSTLPAADDLAVLGIPVEHDGWPRPENAPNRGPVPAGLIDWFAEGAAALETQFARTPAGQHVWTWWRDQTVGFWLRMQAIEAAVHRWDAENAIGPPRPLDSELAADTVGQTFEIMAPARRAARQAPPGSGERFRFRRTDGAGDWTVRFDGDDVRLVPAGGSAEPADVTIAGTASDLALFLWQRLPADRLDVSGDGDLPARYFELVPPL